MNTTNPFLLKGYRDASLFCDREDETQLLITNAKNGANTILYSIRRMGKTGLIYHVFSQMNKEKKWNTIYIDIYATQNIEELTNQIASAILQTFPEKETLGKKFMTLIKGLSPSISYNEISGIPEIAFNYNQPKKYESSLKELFNFLDTQNVSVLVAIDEFQQIANYPEKNTEALLRTIFQSLKNVFFIFSGSHKYMLLEMFNSAKRPFFSSASPLFLTNINKEKYATFIEQLFKQHKKQIDEESILFILEWTRVHTYFTQAVCNKTFAISEKKITIKTVYDAVNQILKEQENIFFQYRKLLTASQWKLLKAIAKEEIVYHPTGNAFLSKYKIGSPASAKRSMDALIEKEMVYSLEKPEGSAYLVYDCFLSRWLER
ncbi:MAG: hypothetical protein K0B10_07055 [Vicingaceae bacterium]|nr:hypothetical protein [Vicingaceae bacterium]